MTIPPATPSLPDRVSPIVDCHPSPTTRVDWGHLSRTGWGHLAQVRPDHRLGGGSARCACIVARIDFRLGPCWPLGCLTSWRSVGAVVQQRRLECCSVDSRVGLDRSGITPGTLCLLLHFIACVKVRSADARATHHGTGRGPLLHARCLMHSRCWEETSLERSWLASGTRRR